MFVVPCCKGACYLLQHRETLGPVQSKYISPNLTGAQEREQQPCPQGFDQAQTHEQETCISLLLPEHTAAVTPLVSESDFSTSHTQAGRGPEFLTNIPCALQGSLGTQRCTTSPKFLEIQMEICYLMGELFHLASLKQFPSPEKISFLSEEKLTFRNQQFLSWTGL